MDILYTSFLQKLVQASNCTKLNDEQKERELLAILVHFQKMVQAQENIVRFVNLQDIAQRIVASPA